MEYGEGDSGKVEWGYRRDSTRDFRAILGDVYMLGKVLNQQALPHEGVLREKQFSDSFSTHPFYQFSNESASR